MSVSLIVTTYNNTVYLRKSIRSLMFQRALPAEVIVADDGSAEETALLVQDLAAAAPFNLRHVWQEHRGFRAAKIRNEAIKASSGGYVILLDGDCVVDRHFVADHLALSEYGCFVQGKRILVNQNAVDRFDEGSTNSIFRLLSLSLLGRISNIHHLPRLTNFPSTINTKLKGIKSCNMSFFRNDILAVNGFNEDFIGWGNEDSELACRFYKYGLLKKVHPFMATCFHLWHCTNKTPHMTNEMLLSAAKASPEFRCRNGIVKAT